MTPRELNEGVQFTVDANNQVTSVVLTPSLWRKILNTLEDSQEQEMAALLTERAKVGPLDLSVLHMRELSEDWA